MCEATEMPDHKQMTEDMRTFAHAGAIVVAQASSEELDGEAFLVIYDNWLAEVERAAAEKA